MISKRCFLLFFVTLTISVHLSWMSRAIDKAKRIYDSDEIDFKIFEKPKYDWRLNIPSDVNINISDSPKNGKLYISIIDTEYKESSHHCVLKKLWVDEIVKHDVVDAVEFYSVNGHHNKECNISFITPNRLPEQKIDPSAFLLLETLKIATKRTDSQWFLFVGDTAYVKVNEFLKYFDNITKENGEEYYFLKGSCVEERYFFQMLLLDSGLLVRRNTLETILSLQDDILWKVSMQSGFRGEEAFAKILDKLFLRIANYQNYEFLGRGFRKESDYDVLQSKNISSLKKCVVPSYVISREPGESGACTAAFIKLNDIVIWSGARFMSKKEFLERAESLLSNLPDNLHFYWDRIYPALCIKD